MNDTPEERIQSGQKFTSSNGITAIKDGVKAQTRTTLTGEPTLPLGRKPPWLRAKIPAGQRFDAVRRTVRAHRLSTVCEESHCPNLGECWSNGTATIMVMGSVCTRACRFCAVDTGNPKEWLDQDEPQHVAQSVELMALRYIVLTSVDRDDLQDGGAAHYAACVRAIKARTPVVKVEALTPDFCGSESAVATVIDAGLDVFAQNVETVKRLTHPVRDPRASYEQTLAILAFAKRHNPRVLTKTSLMVGLGESDNEIIQTLADLREKNVDIVTLGQYLRPTAHHLPVERYVTPDAFNHYREVGLRMGFMEIASGPMVRSSYRADRIFEQNNLGLTLPTQLDSNKIPIKRLD
ncbi:MAG: lipoyl synthase [Gammaproteobacteria bacterium]